MNWGTAISSVVDVVQMYARLSEGDVGAVITEVGSICRFVADCGGRRKAGGVENARGHQFIVLSQL